MAQLLPCLADLGLLVVICTGLRFSSTLHRYLMRHAEKYDKRPYIIKRLKHEINVHNVQKSSSYLAESILHPHYKGRINIVYRFSDNLSDVLSKYHSYSESKVFEAHT
jgi:hypothetical protein